MIGRRPGRFAMGVSVAVGLAGCGDLPSVQVEKTLLTIRPAAADTIVVGDTAVLQAEVIDEQRYRLLDPPIRWAPDIEYPPYLELIRTDSSKAWVLGLRPGTTRILIGVPSDHDHFTAEPQRRGLVVRYEGVTVEFANVGRDTVLTTLGEATLSVEAFDYRRRPVVHGMYALEHTGSGAVTAYGSEDAVFLYARHAGSDTLFLSHDSCHRPCADTLVVHVAPAPAAIDVPWQWPLASLGDSSVLLATVTDPLGHELEGVDVRWRLEDPADSAIVVLLDSTTGLIRARGNGTAVVRATTGPLSDTGSVLVQQLVDTVMIRGLPARIVGITSVDTARVDARDRRGHVVDPAVFDSRWSAAPGGVIGIEELGEHTVLVTPTGYGSATVTAEVTTCWPHPICRWTPFRVSTEVQADADSVRASAGADTLTALGERTPLFAEAFVDGAAVSGSPVDWTALDPAIAVVAPGPLAEAVAQGTARFEARVADAVDTVAVVVRQVPVAAVLDPAPALVVGAIDTLELILQDARQNPIEGVDLTWTTSDPGVVAVDAAGVITAIAAGGAEVRGEAEGIGASISVLGLDPDYELIPAHGQVCILTTGGTGHCGIERLDTLVVVGAHRLIEGAADRWCMLDASALAYCWGSNYRGELGVGDTSFRTKPTPVVGGLKFLDLAIGGHAGLPHHSCGVATDGRAYCWGDNTLYQLGTAGDSSYTPRLVDTALRFSAIDTDYYSSCGLSVDGGVYCWGTRLGGTEFAAPEPYLVAGSERLTTVSLGLYMGCGVEPDGTGRCWGENGGRLGNGETENSVTATPIAGGHRFRQIDPGLYHVCGVTVDNHALCWGLNEDNQLGAATWESPSLVPLRAGGDRLFTQVVAAEHFSAGRLTDGGLILWGRPVRGADRYIELIRGVR